VITIARIVMIAAHLWLLATPAAVVIAAWALRQKQDTKGGAYRSSEPNGAKANQGGRGGNVLIDSSPAPAINQGEI